MITAEKNSKSFIIAAFILTVLTFTAFSGALHHPFIDYDDDSYITENSIIYQQPLSWRSLEMAMTDTHTGDWHPLVWLSFMLEKHFFGLNPAAFHTVNILLHMMNALLIFYGLQRFTGKLWPAFFAAALFAVHPLRAESVAWIAERKDVLSGVFLWLTLGAYLKAEGKTDNRWHFACIFFFILAVMSKPVVVSVPILMLILDFWLLKRLSSWKEMGERLLEKSTFILLSAFSCMMAVTANASIKGFYSLESIPIGVRFLNGIMSYSKYIYQTLWPFHLAVFYPFPHEETASLFWNAAAAAFLIGMTLWTWRKRNSAPYLLAGWLWYLITLIPMIGIVRVSNQSMADRYTYLPHLGLALMAVWGASRLPLKIQRTSALFLGVFTLLFWTFLCRQQVRYWGSPETLNRHAVEVTKNNYVAHGNLGYYYMKRKEFDRAEEQFRKALEIRPFNFFARASLGVLRIEQGRQEEAEKIFLDLTGLYPFRHRPHYYLGLIYASQKKYELAEKHLLKAVRLRSVFRIGKKALAHVYLDMGQYEKSSELLRGVLAERPYDTVANYIMGKLLQRTGRGTEAVSFYERAVSGTPSSPRALSRLTLLLLQQGKGEQAKELLTAALARDPKYFQAAVALSNVYLEERSYDDAVRAAAYALQIDPGSQAAAQLLKEIETARAQAPDQGPDLNGRQVVFGTGLEISSPQDFNALIDVLAQRTGTN